MVCSVWYDCGLVSYTYQQPEKADHSCLYIALLCYSPSSFPLRFATQILRACRIYYWCYNNVVASI